MQSVSRSTLRSILACASLAAVSFSAPAQTLEQAKAHYKTFDARYYHDKYPDLQRAIGNKPDELLMHFVRHGQNELRAPSASGDATKQSYARWAEGCNKGWWGGIRHEVKKGKGGHVVLSNTWHHYCDENVYKYAIAFDEFSKPPRSAHLKPVMRAGDWLRDGEYMVSDGAHFIAAMQPDGNFCVYQGSSPARIHGSNKWCSLQAAGRGSPGNPGKYFAILQGDGNFCIYKGTGPGDNKGGVSCHPGRASSTTPPYYFLALQNDANIAIYRGSGPANNLGWIWDRITTAPPKPDTVWESIGKGIVSGASAVNQAMVDYTKAKETATTTPPW